MEQEIKEAKVIGRDLPISRKHSIEIGDFVRYRTLKQAKSLLSNVLDKKIPVPFKRYRRDVGHKTGIKGISSGRYPQKATKAILKLLNSLEANAQNKGLDTTNLVINFFSATKGATIWHYGRKRRRQMKSTFIEIRVKEKSEKTEVKKVKKENKK